MCSVSLLGRSLEFLLWMGVTLNISSAWLRTEGDLEWVLPLKRCLGLSARLQLFKRKGISLEGLLALSLWSSDSSSKRSPTYCAEHFMAIVLPGLLPSQEHSLALISVLVGCGRNTTSLQHRPSWNWAQTLLGKSGHILSPEYPVALCILIYLFNFDGISLREALMCCVKGSLCGVSVAWVTLLHLFVPQISSSVSQDNNRNGLKEISCVWNEVNVCKYLEQCLACRKHSTYVNYYHGSSIEYI